MTCAWYERQLKDEQVRLWQDGVPTQMLISHARTCALCDALVGREMELQPWLAELAEQTRAAEPSARVKTALLAELDARRPQLVRRVNWIPRVAFAVAAVICLAIGIAIFRHHPVRVETPAAVTPTQPQNARPTVAEQPVKPAKPAEVAAKAARPHAARAKAASVANNSDFLPVVMCDALTCAGPATTVRVELPASPLAGTDNKRKILADLLVGDDGLVRGIRVLQ